MSIDTVHNMYDKSKLFSYDTHTHTQRNNKPIKKRRRRITEKKNEQKTHQLMSREKEQQIVIVNISIIAWRLGVTRLQILNVGSWSNANVCRQELYKRTCFCCAFNLFFFADCFYYFLFCLRAIDSMYNAISTHQNIIHVLMIDVMTTTKNQCEIS